MDDRLLGKIRRWGWTRKLTEQFEREYGAKLRRLVILHMRRLGLSRAAVNPKEVHGLSDRQLEIFQNTVSSLWEKLLGGLVVRYLEGVEKGEIHQEFILYTSGVIRHLVIANAQGLGLLAHETPLVLLQAICRAWGTPQRRDNIAWAKYCLEDRVRKELRSRCPEDRSSRLCRRDHRAADYFFEVFIPKRCERIANLGSRALERLIQEFVEGDEFDSGIQYIGTVTPYRVKGSASEVLHVEDVEDSADDEYADGLLTGVGTELPLMEKPLREERLALWDRLLRGIEVDPDETEEVLFPMAREALEEEKVACAVLLGAARLAFEGSPVMRRNLKAALRYWFSRTGTKSLPRRFNPRRDLEGAGLHEVMGLYLTWPEAMKSVGGNPWDYSALQRVTEALRDEYGRQWERLFGSSPPGMPLGGDL